MSGTAPQGRETAMGKGQRWALLAAFSYTAANLFQRMAAVRVEPVMAAAINNAPTWAVAVALTAATWRRRQVVPGDGAFAGWLPVAAAMAGGLVVFGVGNPLFFWALRLGGVSVAVPSTQTQVLWAALMGALLLAEAVNLPMLAGVGLVLGGLALLAYGQTLTVGLSPAWALALPLGAGAGLCWAFGGLTQRYAMTRGLDRFTYLAFSTTMAQVALHGRLLFGQGADAYAALGWGEWLVLLAGGLLNTLAQISLVSAMVHAPVGTVTSINALNLPMAVVGSWLILKDPLNGWMAAGVLVLTGGVLLYQLARAGRVPGAGKVVLGGKAPAPTGSG